MRIGRALYYPRKKYSPRALVPADQLLVHKEGQIKIAERPAVNKRGERRKNRPTSEMRCANTAKRSAAPGER